MDKGNGISKGQRTLDDFADALPEVMWTYEDVSRVFRVTTQTVMEWVKLGKFPPPTYHGTLARWMPEVIRAVQLKGVGQAGEYAGKPSPRAKIVGKALAKKKEKIALARQRAKPALNKRAARKGGKAT